MKLAELARAKGHRLVAPIISYPAVSLTNTTAKENLTNGEVHFKTIREIEKRFSPDAVMAFMDLSVEVEAMGIPIIMGENESPTVREHPIKTVADVRSLPLPDPQKDGRMSEFIKAQRLMAQNLKTLNGSFVTGPFTVAGLLTGAENLAISTITDSAFARELLDFSAETVLRYARALAEAGAGFICVAEPTAVILSPSQFWEFSGQYVRRLADTLDIPVILHICGNTTHLVGEMCKTGAQALSLDSVVSFPELARRVPGDVVLLGNLDPVRVMVNLDPEGVRRAAAKLLSDMDGVPNFILSTGCDLPVQTPLENVDALCEAGRSWPLRASLAG